MLTRFRTLCALSTLVGSAAIASAGQIEGVLMDQTNSWRAETRVVGGGLEGGILQAYTYTRESALAPASQKSGYGIVTYDGRYLKFDPAGNAKALALLQASKKDDYLKVEVTGDVQGDTIKVASLKFID